MTGHLKINSKYRGEKTNVTIVIMNAPHLVL
jgi:hypothetical protein